MKKSEVRSLIPGATNKYNAYTGTAASGNRLLGVTEETTLNKLESMSETMNFAGSGGELDIPILGQFKSGTFDVKFTNTTPAMFELASKDETPIIFRAAIQYLNPTTQKMVYKNRTITIRGLTKDLDFGSLKQGGLGKPTITKEWTYYKEVIDGETVIEVDKINGKYYLNGVDMTAAINDLI